MRKFLTVAAVAGAIAVSSMSTTLADEGHAHGHDLPVVAGTVTKVDESADKITIAHDAIPNLQMDAMTMVFNAADPTMVAAVKVGDAVQFTADKVNGQLTITEIEKR